jgi:hypothetical protein
MIVLQADSINNYLVTIYFSRIYILVFNWLPDYYHSVIIN